MKTYSESTSAKAWQEGHAAYERQEPAGGCPYGLEKAPSRIEWLEGWMAAHFEAQGRRWTSPGDPLDT